jgi:hypothetical protein
MIEYRPHGLCQFTEQIQEYIHFDNFKRSYGSSSLRYILIKLRVEGWWVLLDMRITLIVVENLVL